MRGGRAGELTVSVLGVPLNDPQTGRALELPLFAVRNADLLVGGLDADHVGSLAGELDVQTDVPTAARAGMPTDDGRLKRNAAAGRVDWPAPVIALFLGGQSAEAAIRRSRAPRSQLARALDWLGGKLRLEAGQPMLAWGKLSPIEHPEAGSIEVAASRSVLAPYNPMFSFDGWVTPTTTTRFRSSHRPSPSTTRRFPIVPPTTRS